MKILVTGAAGFIGFHAAKRLAERGDDVIGLDNLNDYYPVSLKRARLAELDGHVRFRFECADVNDREAIGRAAGAAVPDAILHLAAQAGVRYSVENPAAYVDTNVGGQVAVLEYAASLPNKPPVVYASSSSVYGANTSVPFRESDRVDEPVSVYAATKRAGELIAHAYRSVHGIASTGLRFFTVYGRFGRPDMAPWLFAEALLAGRPIRLFNHGAMERDFTHVSDVVDGVVAALDRIVGAPGTTAPVYNLGNNRPIKLMDFVASVERATGRTATVEPVAMPPGDVLRTFADIELAARDLGFSPKIALDDGMDDFVRWLQSYIAR